jgi:SAM-dependent methyltransferase
MKNLRHVRSKKNKTPEDFSEIKLKQFWNQAAKDIKSFYGSPSTKIYFNQEKRIISNYFSNLEGKSILKTDLWNEAKNTQILKWVLTEKAKAFGVDISFFVTRQALDATKTGENNLFFNVADLRYLPFSNNCFDYVYSMGTAEHFLEYDKACQEMYRVLKPDGKAIIGVPNKYDPFLRPFQVFLLQKLGLYSFGYEKSFSKKEMAQILKKNDFIILDQSSILFMPGILRILDLFSYVHFRPLTKITKVLLSPFEALYNHFEFFRHYGYLIVFLVKKPR